MNTSKARLRTRMKATRAELSVDERAAASRAIQTHILAEATFAAAERWFVYVSFRDEVATRALIDELLAQGKQVFVPRTDDERLMQALEFPGWEAMQTDRFGFLAPPAAAPAARELDVCLCPGLAFTTAGDRLGYGAGHYDRFLARWPTLTTLGLAFSRQLVEQLPRESTDRRMDWIVTEKGLVRCGSF